MNGSIREKFINERRVQGPLQARLASLVGAELELFERLLAALNPSANTLRALLDLLDDLACRDQVSVSTILNESEVQLILCDRDLSYKEKQQRLRRALNARRFPEMTRITRELTESCVALSRAYDIELALPHELEGDAVLVQLKLNSAAATGEAGAKLIALAADLRFKGLFRVLHGEE